MEDNTNATNEGTQAANVGQEGVQGATGTNDKHFTQEEVNSFIQSRLGRMKDQAVKEARAEYEQKLAEVHAKEMQLLLKEQLSTRGMNVALANVITCTDEEDLKAKLDVLQSCFGAQPKGGFYRLDKSGNKIAGSESQYMRNTKQKPEIDPIRAAMGIKE